MKKDFKVKLKKQIKLWIKLILNWRFLVCFGLAWMITNGWSYIMLIVGLIFRFKVLSSIALSYLTFLWLPFTPEKILTVSIALFFVRKLFPKHNQELQEQIMAASNTKKKDKHKD